MCITFHLYRNSDILLYLFKNKQGALRFKEKKKNKDHQIFQSNVVYFICIYFLRLTLEGQVKRVTYMLNSLPAWVMVLLFTPCPNQESVAIFYCNIPFFFSVFINCTVLLHFFFASTVMIKWWLSSSVTFPCHCYCLKLAYVGFRLRVFWGVFLLHWALKRIADNQFTK